MTEFAIKDSGARQEFSGGMVRDTTEGKVNFLSVRFGPMFRRWADHLTKGRTKYPDPEPGRPNWTLADGVEEYLRAKESAARHFEQWLVGDRDEDHAAAVFFNVNLAEFVLERNAGLIDPSTGAGDPPIFEDVPAPPPISETPASKPITIREAIISGQTTPEEVVSKPWHIEPQEREGFRVGDVVLAMTDTPEFNGVGTITEVRPDGRFAVRLDYGGDVWTYSADELTLTPLKERVVGFA